MFVLFIRPVVNAAQASVVDITFLNERSLSSIKTRPDTSGLGATSCEVHPHFHLDVVGGLYCEAIATTIWETTL